MTQGSWDLGGESISFPFDNVGDAIDGIVVSLTERQSTDMETKEPAYWKNGDPKMLAVVTLQTELRDRDNLDDGKRTVALSGSKKPETKSRMAAVVGAVKAATGGTSLQQGGRLWLKYVGDGPRTQKGFTPPKLYEARYQAPAMDLAATSRGSAAEDDSWGPPPGDDEPPF